MLNGRCGLSLWKFLNCCTPKHLIYLEGYMTAVRNISGERFGRLLVVSRAPNKHGRVQWLCLCDCGNTHITYSKTLTNGKSRSCGCLKNETSKARATSHGMNRTKEHKIWRGMKARCSNVNATGYAHYGGRGISVCKEWVDSFSVFLKDNVT